MLWSTPSNVIKMNKVLDLHIMSLRKMKNIFFLELKLMESWIMFHGVTIYISTIVKLKKIKMLKMHHLNLNKE